MAGTAGSDNVVTDGLIFYVDPANTKSYVSGSTSTDSLVGAITGSLINGTSFSGDKHGSWDFDGTDDRLEINDLVDIPLANSSFNIWVRPNQGLGEGRAYQWSFGAIGSYPALGLAYTPPEGTPSGFNSGSYDILSGNSGGNRFVLNTTGSIFQKEWTNVCVTKESGGTTGNKYNCKIYVNGTEQDTYFWGDTAVQDWWVDNLSLTSFNLAYKSLNANTNISSFSVYNRAITQTEIKQNYNALKHRFASRFITDGLILNLDAANYASYPGSGNTWFDIAESNDGTLVNTPTFDLDGGGSILFDGTDDRVEISPIGNTISGYEFGTLSMWFKIPSTTTNITHGLFSVYEGVNARYDLIIGEATSGQPNESLMSIFINGSIEYAPTVSKGHTYYFDDTWHNIVFTVDSGPTPNTKIYIDGILQTLGYPFGSNSGVGFTNLSPTTITLGSGYYAGAYTRPLEGNIANVAIYNRAITSEEQLFNYNELKHRFGL